MKENICHSIAVLGLIVGMAVISLPVQAAGDEQDKLVNFSVLENIGTAEKPEVTVDVTVKKRREMMVVLKSKSDMSSTLKRLRIPIKKSKALHFTFEYDDLGPGKYQIGAYLVPVGKEWDERVGNAVNKSFTVVDAPKYVKQTEFSDEDRIKRVNWPKTTPIGQGAELIIAHNITRPRTVVIQLFDRDTKKSIAKIDYPVNAPGNINLAGVDLGADFPAGNYVWVVFIAESGQQQAISNTYRLSFELVP